jgi:DNA modification methylase
MVAVFREVRRTLTDDGTLWLNIGDSYARAGGWSNNSGLDGVKRSEGKRPMSNMTAKGGASQMLPKGFKPKDLVGIPWRLAFALQADGWWLRQDIIWHKPNPMPESVTDRCTKAHEYLFLLTKSAKYYYDSEAIKEPMAEVSIERQRRGVSSNHKNISGAPGQTKHTMNQAREHDKLREVSVNRNRRSVWTITTKPFKGAHFAVMPEALAEPCILAGSATGDLVLDPFTGSGTTAVVALRHDRKFVGVELNDDYTQIAKDRINKELEAL